MPLEPFKTSQAFSLGVELELQLINLSDFNLTAASPDLLNLLTRDSFPGIVTPEITESMIEIATDVHMCYATLVQQLRGIRTTLIKAGDRLNIGLCGGGTHPFQLWAEQKNISKTSLSASVCFVWLPCQTVHGFWPACACRLYQW